MNTHRKTNWKYETKGEIRQGSVCDTAKVAVEFSWLMESDQGEHSTVE